MCVKIHNSVGSVVARGNGVCVGWIKQKMVLCSWLLICVFEMIKREAENVTCGKSVSRSRRDHYIYPMLLSKNFCDNIFG